jgi:hypothetical protein
MTQEAIQKQIEAIKKVNAEARQSKETALKFLTGAGIIKDNPKKEIPQKKEK